MNGLVFDLCSEVQDCIPMNFHAMSVHRLLFKTSKIKDMLRFLYRSSGSLGMSDVKALMLIRNYVDQDLRNTSDLVSSVYVIPKTEYPDVATVIERACDGFCAEIDHLLVKITVPHAQDKSVVSGVF